MLAVGVGMDVRFKKKEMEEGGADVNSNLLDNGLEPCRTDLGILLTHLRLDERKVVVTALPQGLIGGREN